MKNARKSDWLWIGSRILALSSMVGLLLVLWSDYKTQRDQVSAEQIVAGLFLIASLITLIFVAFDFGDN